MKKLIQFADRILVRYTPDPFVIAIGLSWLTVVLAWLLTDMPFVRVVHEWGSGFWTLAEFTLQMVMMLLGGYVVATSPPVMSVLRRLVGFLHTPAQGVLFCTLATLIACWLNWGMGLVVGALVAVETGRRLPRTPYRVLVASSYTGFLVWHGGLSGSIPLSVNTPGNFSLKWLGGETMPLRETLFGSVNLAALAALLIMLPLLNLFLLKVVGTQSTREESIEPLPPVLEADSSKSAADDESALFVDRTIWMAAALLALATVYIGNLSYSDAFTLNLNSLTMILFMLGLILHGSPRRFSASVADATPKVAPILIQYPLYAAIMAVLVESGLATKMADWFVRHATAETFPLMTFYSAGLINLFVPSGGGQWSVQAPIVLPAAQALGADLPKTVMAVAWGDAWTNMAQPFWAVPLLAIAGLKIRDMIGLCLVTLVASGVVLSLIFWLV